MKKLLPLLIFPILFIACGNDKEKDEPLALDFLYFDYQVTGEEGNDNLTVKAEFRIEDREGDAVSIDRMGEARLDGQMLEVDSTPMTGYFYEAYRPIATFAGPHELSFTARVKNSTLERKENFSFTPLVLQTIITDTVKRADLVLEIEGIGDEDVLRVVLTDTSAGDGINRNDTAVEGKITVSAAELEKLANGPVMLELIRETEKELSDPFEAGGRLLITYSLRRQFILTD